ncbi:MAG: hypothetical protein KBC84_06430 [Proteobacteria bacterium]|nr:hypothetical protein [Pseudomonadota bacterium]
MKKNRFHQLFKQVFTLDILVKLNSVQARSFILLLLCCLCNSLGIQRCQAQNKNSNKLFNGSALAKADLKLRESISKSKLNDSFGNSIGARFTEDVFSLSSVESVVNDPISGNAILDSYAPPLYFTYLSNVNHVDDAEEIFPSNQQERFIMYEGVNTAITYVKESGLKDIYQYFIEELKVVRRYTSLNVNQKTDGGYKFSSKESNSQKPLMVFRLHLNTSTVVEPRVEVGKNFLIRYDIRNQAPVMEIRSNF